MVFEEALEDPMEGMDDHPLDLEMVKEGLLDMVGHLQDLVVHEEVPEGMVGLLLDLVAKAKNLPTGIKDRSSRLRKGKKEQEDTADHLWDQLVNKGILKGTVGLPPDLGTNVKDLPTGMNDRP